MNPSFNFVSQAAHVGWGFIFVAVPTLLFGPEALWWSVAAAIVAEAIKEYWDAHGLETPQVAGSSWEDFAFWVVGNCFAIVVILISYHA